MSLLKKAGDKVLQTATKKYIQNSKTGKKLSKNLKKVVKLSKKGQETGNFKNKKIQKKLKKANTMFNNLPSVVKSNKELSSLMSEMNLMGEEINSRSKKKKTAMNKMKKAGKESVEESTASALYNIKKKK